VINMNIEYKPYDTDTGYLFPPSLADSLGPDDEVHIFKEVTEHLDISYLDSDFNGIGQHPYHPLMLLRLLMWGMANRVVSTRRIEVLSRRDVSYIYVAGGQRPDYRTLSRFRRRNAREIKRLFKETVLLCAQLGMVNLGHIALDGTKLKASTSKHKAMSYGRMKEEEKRLEREIEELMRQAEEIDEEEDRIFGKDNNGYNLPEELKRREERLKKIRQLKDELEIEKRQEQGLKEGETPVIEAKEQRSFADDNGYFSTKNLAYEGKGIELLIASGREGKEEKDRRTLPVNKKQIQGEMKARKSGYLPPAQMGSRTSNRSNKRRDGIQRGNCARQTLCSCPVALCLCCP
jgi:transposase